MLNSIKSFIKASLNAIGYELHKSNILTASDDPFFILSKILYPDKINCIVDAGASIGNTSTRFSNLFPYARIHSIEPYSIFYRTLHEVAKGNSNIVPHNIALSNFNGKSKLNINYSEGTNSFLDMNPEHSEIFGNLLKKENEVVVKCITLDSFTEENNIDDIDILKLDLQGYESTAIEGASNILGKDKVGVILCEIIFEDFYKGQTDPFDLIKSLLDKYSFSFFNLYQMFYHRGKLLQADAIFIHKSKLNVIRSNCENTFHCHSKFLL